MESKVNYAIVGAFVLILSGLGIAALLWFASGGDLQKKYDLYVAYVNESVAGLSRNAPVKYRGVDVGRVQDISLNPRNSEQVRLVFAIERGAPVKEDTEAVLKTQGLTGIAYVELSGGSPSSPPLRAKAAGDYPEIRTKPSLSARLENVLTTLMSKLDSTSDSVNKILSDENVAAFKTTLANLSVLTKTLAARKDTIDAGITSAARTFDNSAKVSAQLASQLKDLGPTLERIGKSADAVRKMGEEAALASSSAGRTIDSAGVTIDTAGRAIDSISGDVKRFTADALPEMQRLMTELNTLTGSLRRLIEETERNPRGFLFGRRPVPEGPGEVPNERQRR